MEDKLLELKEEFCKWYCSNKQKEIEKCNNKMCDNCDAIERVICHGRICEACQVSEYIRHIRDELK